MADYPKTSLKRRFLRMALLVALVKLTALITLVWTSMRLTSATEVLVQTRACADATSDATSALFNMRREALHWRVNGDRTHLDNVDRHRRVLESSELDRGCGIKSSRREAQLPITKRAIADYLDAQRRARLIPTDAPISAFSEVRRKYQRAHEALHRLDELNTMAGMRAAGRAQEVQRILQRTGTVVGIGSIVVVGGLLLMLQRELVAPMHRLTEAIRGMQRNGEVGARLGLGLGAELGEIERAVDGLSHQIAEKRTAQYQLIAAVAHELKNPLQSIRAYSSFVRGNRSLPSEPSLRKGFEVIDRQAEKLGRQLDDLLDAARVQGGAIELEKTAFDLGELVRETGACFDWVSDKHRIELDASLGMLAFGDRLRLGQVLTNLIGNAVKYSPQGGCITVVLRKVGDEARISVRDEGIGIEKEQLAKLFEPFRRSSAVRGMDIPGVGLGLATSRWIVEAHGGRIEVESELGKGSTFTVRLPLPSENSFYDDHRETNQTSSFPVEKNV